LLLFLSSTTLLLPLSISVYSSSLSFPLLRHQIISFELQISSCYRS
jgi:hypothetical protein